MNKKNGMAYTFKKGTNDKNVVFVHGSGCNKSLFNGIIELLPEHNCYSVDLPGHGDSDNTGYSLENYISSVADFVKDLENVILVGHSLGATIVLGVSALDIPSITGSLVLSGGATFPKLDKEFMKKIHKGKVDKLYLMKGCGSIFNKDVFKALMNLESNDVIIKDFLIDEVLDITDCLKNIKVPTHIVVGADDIITLIEYSELLNKEIENSKLTVIPGYRHMLFLAEKAKTAQFIREF